ncbi:MAG: undecaprenyl-diphosphatase UppP [Armatimonadota bacterium]
MNVVQAIILGAIQGLTEFLPISSSAHLAIIPWALKWDTPGLTFDVSLHLGTLFAITAYFWRDWYEMISAYIGTTKFARKKISAKYSILNKSKGTLLWPIIVACLPAGIAGIGFEHLIENTFRENPYIIAYPMIILGILLLIADRYGKKTKPMESISPKDWIIIGLAQALAIIPGVSRSGVTITAGLFCGLQRDASARFSFLLGSPIIFGAALYKMLGIARDGLPSDQIVGFISGTLTATIVGYLCIGFLMEYLKKRSMGVFVGYRIAFGVGMLIIYALSM